MSHFPRLRSPAREPVHASNQSERDHACQGPPQPMCDGTSRARRRQRALDSVPHRGRRADRAQVLEEPRGKLNLFQHRPTARARGEVRVDALLLGGGQVTVAVTGQRALDVPREHPPHSSRESAMRTGANFFASRRWPRLNRDATVLIEQFSAWAMSEYERSSKYRSRMATRSLGGSVAIARWTVDATSRRANRSSWEGVDVAAIASSVTASSPTTSTRRARDRSTQALTTRRYSHVENAESPRKRPISRINFRNTCWVTSPAASGSA